MKQLFGWVALATLIAIFALAPIPAIAGGSGNHGEGTRTRECQTFSDGSRQCQTVWTSTDGVVQRGHWEYTSGDGSYTARGQWWSNYAKRIYWGMTFSQWLYRW